MEQSKQRIFNRIEKTTTGGAVREQVLEAIAQGELQPGQRVPTERELAELFQISRPALREGIKSLVFAGILEQRGSGGTYVAQSINDSILQTSIQMVPVRDAQEAIEIVEARRAIECELCRLAAERRTEEDIATMAVCLEGLAGCAEDNPERAALDFAFHSALGEAAHSSILHSLQTSLSRKILEVMRKSIYVPKVSEAGHREHVAIFEAVRDGEGANAGKVMYQHLLHMENRLRKLAENNEFFIRGA